MHQLKVKGIVNNSAEPDEGLPRRVVRGGVWVFALRITERAFSLIRLIILARILAPHDFGLMGIALLTMATLETFSETGFRAALIQKRDNVDAYLDAAWTVLILRGFLLFVILFFIAPYAAIFFKAPQARSIIQVIGLSVLLQAFTNIGVIYFRKELEFNKQFLYQISGTLADFIVAISAVLILRSVWALVFGLLAGNVARLIASYLIHPHRPHLSGDLRKAKELFGFGKWVLASSILIFLLIQGDDIFVGKLLGATMLGFYQMAYRISNMPATEITHVISQVTFPAYSKLQDNLPRLREAYLKFLQVTAFLSFPIAGMIFILAPDFTKVFLGDKWMPMVPAMQVLAFFGLARSISYGSLFQAAGRPDLTAKITFLRLLVMAIIIYPLSLRLGIAGTSWAVLGSNVAFAPLAAKKAIGITKCDARRFITVVFLPILGTFVMILGLICLKQAFIFLSLLPIVKFSFSLVIGIILYFCIMLALDKSSFNNFRFLLDELRAMKSRDK